MVAIRFRALDGFHSNSHCIRLVKLVPQVYRFARSVRFIDVAQSQTSAFDAFRIEFRDLVAQDRNPAIRQLNVSEIFHAYKRTRE